MDVLSWLTFALVAGIIVIIVVGVSRYWKNELNMSEEDIALERRISDLNKGQANRRPDDEIVRLLRGDEQRVVGDEEER